MRFTKIPLIATLMAVALSLLIVLPTLAQQDITDGKQGNGVIAVGIFDDIADAQMGKLARSTFSFASDRTPADEDWPYIPADTPAHLSTLNATAGTMGVDDPAYLADRRVDPQNTFFRRVLYVSNDNVNDEVDDPGTTGVVEGEGEGAYNTVLINVQHPGDAAQATSVWGPDCVLIDGGGDGNVDDPGPEATVKAVVRNNRSTRSITIELAVAAAGDGTHAIATDRVAGRNAQGFFKVVPDDGINKENDGPQFCHPTEDLNEDGDTTDPGEAPVTSADNDGIAQIPARHGDRLVITVPGQSGRIELTVDGLGPDFSAITPEDNAVTRSSRLTYGFEVRDDDSGLRHDGESVISPDDDLREINPDGDQILHNEPLSVDPETAVPANGAAADIDVHIADNPMSTAQDPPAVEYRDISASGEWRMAGSRAGVAYAFTASGADKNDDTGGNFLYRLRARDRAGNWTVTDADDSNNVADEPFVFRVDDTDPALVEARTGIAWDADKDREKVDRSYIALEFKGGGANGSPDALGDVDTGNITVVGYTIVGFIRPNEAPSIDRNLGIPKRADYPPTVIRYTPDEPALSQPSARTDADESAAWIAARDSVAGRTSAQVALLLLEGRWTQHAANVTTIDIDNLAADADAPEPDGTINGVTTEPTECAGDLTTIAAGADVQICGQWDQYIIDKAAYDAAAKAKTDATADHQAAVDKHNAAKTPGTEINDTADKADDNIPEPRSRVYIELSEDLPSDAKPDVVVVGGAVHDLAGNTNEADTIEAMDWIAPGLTVTVTGTANDRPVANDDGSFTIDVRSDEDLARRPKVYFVSVMPTELNDDEDGYDYTIATASEANSITQQEDENHWAKTYKVDSPDFEAFNNQLVGVVVLADDDAENSGATAGWSPGAHREAAPPMDDTAGTDENEGDAIDVGKLDGAGLLIELDDQFNGNEAPVGTVTPRSDADGEETESANPFVRLSFSDEDGEYDACPEDADGNSDCASGADAADDSHDTVTVTAITLNGDDVLGNLNRVNATDFSLVTRDLAVDTHEVTYTAEDDAGNEYDGEFSFEVKERQPYEIAVSPGWNLVSLPATPIEPAIDAVLSGNQYISPVLGYQQGDWITAVREEDGTWRGRLTEIVGGYGYWVHARTFESVETMLAEVDQAQTLPTVPVTAGWNLLGVLDIFQNDEGDAPGETVRDEEAGTTTVGDGEADNYFSSIPWRVAYSYNTTHSQWEKTVPDVNDNADDEVQNGKGYWVWSPTPGTLVP